LSLAKAEESKANVAKIASEIQGDKINQVMKTIELIEGGNQNVLA